MLHIKRIEDGAELFKALGSNIRISILRLLIDNEKMSMNEIAQSLGISNGALTSHVKMLEETGLIKTDTVHSAHGNQKMCSVNVDQILVDIDGDGDDKQNLLPSNTQIDQLTLSFEIASEAPGVFNNWPSDITFRLNGVNIGTWTSPGDFGDVRGIFTPDWWFENWNQYGLLKMLAINKKGTFIDGLKISDVNVKQLKLDYKSTLRFEFAVEDASEHVGGFTLYGTGFGNYNQDIKVQIAYSQMPANQ